MQNLFYNGHENRPRAGWRILIFIIIFWCLSATALIIKPWFGDISKREFLESYSLVIISILAISASVAVPLARKFLDRQPLIALGLQINNKTSKDMIFGFILSGLMAAAYFAIMLALDLIEFNGLNFNYPGETAASSSGFLQLMSTISLASLAILFLETALVGWWEELVFRGYLLQNMIAGMGLNVAVVISCLIYGLIHATNPNAGLLSSSIIVLFGYLRIYGYLRTGMLWLPMGMHIGWNFFQGPVFGFAASGHKKIAICDVTINDPAWLSGGAFGPEGSVIIIPIIFTALLLMAWWTEDRRLKSNVLQKPN
jgi:membrane protease YdiL (CAAX protease family)